MKVINEFENNNEIITKIDDMIKNCPLDMVYFNVVFTENEIILDFLNRSFKNWILRIKPYKVLKYEGIDISTIKKRHEENIVIKYKDIEKIKFSDRTPFKNAYIEISANGLEKNLRLFNRSKIDLEKHYNLVKGTLSNKIDYK